MARDFHVTKDSHDKEGRPLGSVDIWQWHIRTGIIQGRGQRGLRYVDMLIEDLTMQVFEEQAQGKNVTQFKVLGNAEGIFLFSHYIFTLRIKSLHQYAKF